MSESQSASPGSVSGKTLPGHPNLDWLKNRAQERLAELRAGDPAAKLADAQLAIAREYGFASWRKLKETIDQMRADTEPDEKRKEILLGQFRAAVNRQDTGELRQLLEAEPFVRRSINSSIFAFDGLAILRVHSEPMFDLLLEYGADINAKSKWWAGPWGVLDGADEKTGEFLISRGAKVDIFGAANLNKLDVMRKLLDADAGLVNAKGGDGCRPLHFARTPEAVDLLLERGADIDARDVDHESTAAQWAMPRAHAENDSRRNFDRIRYLLRRGAQPDIFMAAALNDVPLLRTIVDTDPSLMDFRVGGKGYAQCPDAPGRHIYVYTLSEGLTALQVAADFGSEDCARFMVSRGSTKQRFLWGCSLGDAALANAALAESPNLLEELSLDDRRALPAAAWNGNPAAVRLMLDFGFNPLTPGADSGTALHCAAWKGFAEIVKIILAHPAVKKLGEKVINAVESTHNGRPLGWCCHGSVNCRNPKGDYAAVAKMLIAVGAIGATPRGASDAVRHVLETEKRDTSADY
jgi:ankyrin repeat protein